MARPEQEKGLVRQAIERQLGIVSERISADKDEKDVQKNRSAFNTWLGILQLINTYEKSSLIEDFSPKSPFESPKVVPFNKFRIVERETEGREENPAVDSDPV